MVAVNKGMNQPLWKKMFRVSEESAGELVDSRHSRPNEPVRHAYPVAIKDAKLGTAMGLMAKTLPYALIRFAILGAMTVAGIVWFAGGFGLAMYLAHRDWGLAALIVTAIVIGPPAALWRTALRYGLALIRYGHVAVLTELITTGQVANGQEHMFSYGKRRVLQHFGQVNLLLGLGLLVHGIVRAFNRTLDWVSNLIPIPGVQSAASAVKAVLHASTTYVDETIFSYNLARGDANPWRSSRDGLIYYAQNSKEVLKTGVWVVILDVVASAVTFAVMLLPAALISLAFPSGLMLYAAVAMAAVFAANVRAAFLEPLFLTMVMTKFHVTVQNQAINPTWDERLTKISDKFVELKDKARARLDTDKVGAGDDRTGASVNRAAVNEAPPVRAATPPPLPTMFSNEASSPARAAPPSPARTMLGYQPPRN